MNIQENFYKCSHQQHSVTQLWRHTAHKNLKFRQFTYTAALFTATVLLLLMELTEQTTKCTVQQPFTVPTDSVQWTVQWTLCAVGATDWVVAVHNTVIYLVVCVYRLLVAAVGNWLSRVLFKKLFSSVRVQIPLILQAVHYRANNSPSVDQSTRPIQSISSLRSVSRKSVLIISPYLCSILPNG